LLWKWPFYLLTPQWSQWRIGTFAQEAKANLGEGNLHTFYFFKFVIGLQYPPSPKLLGIGVERILSHLSLVKFPFMGQYISVCSVQMFMNAVVTADHRSLQSWSLYTRPLRKTPLSLASKLPTSVYFGSFE